MFNVTIVVGDWSHDGHNMTETFVIESNLSKNEIEKAYDEGTKKLGFNFIDSVCEGYEDNVLTYNLAESLKSAGIEIDPEDDNGNDGYYLDVDTYMNLYFQIVKLSNPQFEYKFLNRYDATINIGGYGLFS